jgi:hypothetical protein
MSRASAWLTLPLLLLELVLSDRDFVAKPRLFSRVSSRTVLTTDRRGIQAWLEDDGPGGTYGILVEIVVEDVGGERENTGGLRFEGLYTWSYGVGYDWIEQTGDSHKPLFCNDDVERGR